MVINEEFRAVFKGKMTSAMFWCKREGDSLLIRKPNKFLPFLSKYVVVLSNIGQYLDKYEERILIDPNDGRTEIKIRFYNFDFDTFERDFSNGNVLMERTIDSLSVERDLLLQENQELKSYTRDTGNNDVMRRRIKDDHSFWTGLKPDYSFNQNKDDKGAKKK